MKRVLAVLLSAVLSLSVAVVPGIQTLAEEPDAAQKTEGQQEAEVEVQAPSAVLMEASTGAVLYEKDADTRRAPASVTKIMTMLLIFDALEDGKIALEDEVSTSEYAASMGGSQVFLEPCNGLDTEGHLTTARDIALMSRELIEKYPKIHDYCMIWMDTITHTTKKGTSEFGLSNTNKLVRQYPYATGLKTGSTDEAKFCVSATAEKDGMELIAVILGGENSKQRFQDATKLLNYGFGKCQVYEDNDPPKLKPVEVQGGVKEQILCEYADTFRYLDTSGANLAGVTKKTQMKQSVKAPVKKGQKVGELVYKLGEKEIGRVEILAKESCKKAEFLDYLKKVMQKIRV